MIMHILSGLVVIGCGMCFILLTMVVFARPAAAERFFRGFASSARPHFAEQILRVLFGAALVIYSVAMWQTNVFQFIGWVIVCSSVGLMILPWQWHHQFGKKILPVFIQYMRLYAIGCFAFGAVILYAVFIPHFKI